MKGAGPGQDSLCKRRPVAAAKRLANDRLDAPRHLLRGTPGKGKEQNALRADALDNKVRNAMRERHRLAGPCAGNHEQRPCCKITIRRFLPERGSLPLRGVQAFQVIRLTFRGLCHNCIFIQYWMYLHN
jgi:hypothetical protein